MTDDMRPEAGRWQMLETMLAANQLVFHELTIWSPRLASGSWYTNVAATYWTDYAKARYGATTTVTAVVPPLSGQAKGFLAHDYGFDSAAQRFVAVMARLDGTQTNTTNDTAKDTAKDTLLVYRQGGFAHTRGDYVLTYQTAHGQSVRVPLESQKALPGHDDFIVLRGLDFVPSTVQLLRTWRSGNPPELALCALHLPNGALLALPGTRADSAFPVTSSPPHLLAATAEVFVEGWSDNGADGRWSLKPRASIHLPASILPPGDLVLEFDVATLATMGIFDIKQNVAIRAGRADVVNIAVEAEALAQADFSFALKPGLMIVKAPLSLRNRAGDLDFTITVMPMANPRQLKLSDDARDLGVFLRRVTVR